MPYKVTVQGQTFTTDDLTLDEAVAIEAATGETWRAINPLRSAAHCREIMTCFLARTKGRDDAASFVGALSMNEALDGVEFEADPDLPSEYSDGMPVPGPKAEP